MSAITAGSRAHEEGVERLRESYASIPAESSVRLAKRTSNLFRPRSAPRTSGLDVSGLGGVISVDPGAATADAQGMCSYERLVAATLPYGLMPLVVPQLRTITVGGAVSGLGIESTSFRNGLPHESVLELDVLTGSGDVVTARPDGDHADLFEMFPNSYGSLGYATRLRIELEPVQPFVALRHLRVRIDELASAVAVIVDAREYNGDLVDFLDGVAFSPEEAYLTLGRWADDVAAPSDYSGSGIYYRSIAERESDALSTSDYLWRWDTDWFWCSRAFGAQHPLVRRLWPARYRRSDVYHRLLGIENRWHVAARVDRMRGRPGRERVVQDVEIPIERLAEFLRWFDASVGMRPVWLCPLRLREAGGPDSARSWPLYPLTPGRTYVNVGFWGTVPIADGAADGDVNREIEASVTALDGHKSLYSDIYYDEQTFERLYNAAHLTEVRRRYDPQQRLTRLYDKVVGRR